ncbi:MAG: sugar phosphate nucleotidyltransferase [Nocardioidaceae bacterium]
MKIFAIIQAGGAGGRMDVLTRERAKPALPFAGVYRLIDFPLSNLANSGISDLWLSLQYQGASIEEPVANGRPWDLDRIRGGLRLLMPEQGTGTEEEDGFAQGNADELFRIRDQIRNAGMELVIVLSADHVYRFDLMDAVATHRRLDAECTMVTSEVPLEEAEDHATVERGRTVVHQMPGYWRDLGQPHLDVAAHQDILVAPGSWIAGTVGRGGCGRGRPRGRLRGPRPDHDRRARQHRGNRSR